MLRNRFMIFLGGVILAASAAWATTAATLIVPTPEGLKSSANPAGHHQT